MESLINLLKALCARENDVKEGRQRLPVTKIITEIIHGRHRINAIIYVCILIQAVIEKFIFNNTDIIEIKITIKILSIYLYVFSTIKLFIFIITHSKYKIIHIK